MIKNIIFDFGDIFINLDKKLFAQELEKLEILQTSKETKTVLDSYEMGLISTKDFITYFQEKLNISRTAIVKAWNAILLDFPQERLDFILELAKNKKYRLFLLSNTNEMHISWIQEHVGKEFYIAFKSCFEQFYLSHEIHLRKPNTNIYNYVLKANSLVAEETLFIDDTEENIIAANSIGIKGWHLKPGKEDVTELFTNKHI